MTEPLVPHGDMRAGGVATPETVVFKALSGSKGQGSEFKV